MKKWFEVFNENDLPVILVNTFIGKDDEEVNYSDFSSAITTLTPKHKSATIRLNTGGGAMYEGFAIYDCAKESGLDITTHIVGMAASMGAVLSQCATKGKRKMSRNAMMMIHKAKGLAYGESSEIRSQADHVDELESKAVSIFMETTGKTEQEVKSWMLPGVDKWINAQEALALNLIDEIVEPVNPQLISNVTKMSERQAWNTVYNSVLTPQHTTMKKELLIRLGLKEDATQQQIDIAIESLLEVKQTLDNERKAAKTAKVIALVDGAINEGRLDGKRKDSMMKLAENDFEAAKDVIDGLTKPAKGPLNAMHQPGVSGQDPKKSRAAWTFMEWSKKDSVGLTKMKAEDPQMYQSLYERYYVTKEDRQ